MENLKTIALAQHLSVDESEIVEKEPESYGVYIRYTYLDEEYLVLTNEEADKEFTERCRDFVNDVSRLPDSMQTHFNYEAFAEEVLTTNGRGFMLSQYNNEEHDEEVEGNIFYIYRID